MFVDDDMDYYAQRERAERGLAANAQSEAARNAHLALASAYRRKAMAMTSKDGTPAFLTQLDRKVVHPA